MSFVSPLPATGPWTSLGLTRAAFFAVLLGSSLMFLVVPSPLWTHLRDGHFTRLAVSYAVIPAAIATLLALDGRLTMGLLLRGTLVLALLKLVLTTVLMMAIALAR